MSRWRSLGPACALGGRLPSGGSAPFAGACTALAVSDDGRTLFVGADGGGVWATTDAGVTWRPIFDDQPTLHVAALAWHAGAIWVGCSRVERGATTPLFRGEPLADGFVFAPAARAGARAVRRLVSDGTALWAATDAGLFRDAVAVAAGDASEVVVAGTSPHAVIGAQLVAFGADGASAGRASSVGARTGLFATATTVYVASQTDGGLVVSSFPVGGSPAALAPPVIDGGGRPALLHDGTRLLVGAGRAWALAGGALVAATVGAPAAELAGGVRALLSAGAAIWAATDGGVWLSSDHGATWSARNLGLSICAIEALADHPGAPSALLAGTRFGTLRRVGHPIWWVVDASPTHAAHVEHQDTTRMFALAAAGVVRRSTNAGDSWHHLAHDGIIGELALGIATSGSIYLGADTVYGSDDHGVRFAALATLPAGAGRVTVIAPSRFPGVVWAGTASGSIVRFARGDDERWTAVMASVGTTAVCALAAHPSSADVALAALAGVAAVSRITRSGVALAVTSAAAPGAVTALAVDYRYQVLADLAGIAPGFTLYAGGGFGVAALACADDGAWPAAAIFTAVGDGLPNATVTAIAVSSPCRLIRVGTDGRGVWERVLDPAPTGAGASFPRDDDAVYLRHNDADVGRWPGYYFGAHPLAPSCYTHWSDGVDIKIEASPASAPPPADALAFELLPHRRLPRNTAFRVHVQLHARGAVTGNVDVRLYWAQRRRGSTLPAAAPDAPAEQQRFYWQHANPHSVVHRTRGHYPVFPRWPDTWSYPGGWTLLGSAEIAAPSEAVPRVVTIAPTAVIDADADAIGLVVVVGSDGEADTPSWIEDLARGPRVALKEVTYGRGREFGHVVWRSELPQLPRSERGEPEMDAIDYRPAPGELTGTPLADALAGHDDARFLDLVDGYLLRFADARFVPAVCKELARWFVEADTRLDTLASVYGLDRQFIQRELEGIKQPTRGDPSPDLTPDGSSDRYTRVVPHYNPSDALNKGRIAGIGQFTRLSAAAARDDWSLYLLGDGWRCMDNPPVPNPRYQYFSSPLRAAILRDVLVQWTSTDPAKKATFERLLALATTPGNRSALPVQPQFAQPAPFSSREMFAYLLTEAIDDRTFDLLEGADGTRTAAGAALLEICKTRLVYPWPGDEADAAYSAWRATRPVRDYRTRVDLEEAGVMAVEIRGTPYPFELVLLPSFSPSNVGNELPRAWPFSAAVHAEGAARLLLGKADFDARLAPFVMVSGGNIYPQGTQVNDAIEMKRYLVDVLGMPPSAVIVEPHARHSTTNIRNCSRYLVNAERHITDGVLITTTGGQTGYLSGAKVNWLEYLFPPLLLIDIPHWSAHFFRSRCAEDLGYIPADITPVMLYRLGEVGTSATTTPARIARVDSSRSVMVAVDRSYLRATLHDPLDP